MLAGSPTKRKIVCPSWHPRPVPEAIAPPHAVLAPATKVRTAVEDTSVHRVRISFHAPSLVILAYIHRSTFLCLWVDYMRT